MLQPDSDEVIEATRLDRVKCLRQVPPRGLSETACTALTLMKAIDDQLAGTPFIATDPELYRMTYRAFESLYALHEALGHLDARYTRS